MGGKSRSPLKTGPRLPVPIADASLVMGELVVAASAFLTAGSYLQKRELPAMFRRFELGMRG
jgi:hypothetical protein